MTSTIALLYNYNIKDIMMVILTLENEAFSLNNVPDEVDEHLRFAVLDNSTPQNPDFYFQPLIFLESFSSPALVLKIGQHEITVPLDWCVVIGDPFSSCDLEVLPLTSLNDRGFSALVLNPLTSFRVEFMPIEIVNFYNDFKWYFPKMRNNQLLAMPLSFTKNPLCAFFVKEVARQSELIKLDKLL